MIHPLQYQIENARHLDSLHLAARQRLVADAEHLTRTSTPFSQIVTVVAARVRGYARTALRMAALSHAEA